MYNDRWYKIPNDINLSVPIKSRKNVYKEIFKVSSFLDNLNSCKYFFSCGTALGLVRDGKLLDWDTDVDIDILSPDLNQIEKIINFMFKNNYSFQRVLKRDDNYIQIVFVKKPYHSIDFCFWYKKGNSLVNDVPETNLFIRSHPKSIYKKFKKIKLGKNEFRLPFDTNSYFELLYGSDWRTPKKYKFWLSNASDLKIDLNFKNIFFKILWRLYNKVNSLNES